ncbi:21099_t:CDS:2 [Gigaspora margarita]|uniref:21099_t:CDS:1 n=1 Tax=Gigaspora margarita TaxID=4874 RepID=A0ABN7VLJ3_GIGMA|nr:21099_t:CDS:2 [Gigaspora margarita]
MSKSSHSNSIHTSESLTEATSNEGSQLLTGKKIAAANSQVLGIFTIFQRSTLILKYCCKNKCLAFIIIFSFIAALTTLLSGIIFTISTTPQTSGLMPINSNSLNIDPLTPCSVGDTSCPVLLQDRFRFMWLQSASDVLINGITKQLSVNDPGGKRKVMVAVVDNDTSINYKFVKDNKKSVPVFKVINLQQDDLNETTIMTVNIIKILSLNSKCEGISIDTAKFKLSYPEISKNITCYMNMHVENVESVSAGCKGDCPVIGFRFTNSSRVNYSSLKPVYSDYMHKLLAIYSGNILISQCIDNLVGRSLLSNNGTIVNVQSVVKGKADLKWSTCEYEYNFNYKHQIMNYWLSDKENDSETEKAKAKRESY